MITKVHLPETGNSVWVDFSTGEDAQAQIVSTWERQLWLSKEAWVLSWSKTWRDVCIG